MCRIVLALSCLCISACWGSSPTLYDLHYFVPIFNLQSIIGATSVVADNSDPVVVNRGPRHVVDETNGSEEEPSNDYNSNEDLEYEDDEMESTDLRGVIHESSPIEARNVDIELYRTHPRATYTHNDNQESLGNDGLGSQGEDDTTGNNNLIPYGAPGVIRMANQVAIGVPVPFPMAKLVPNPMPIKVEKTIAVPVERKVPFPVERQVLHPIEKLVPVTIEKHVPYPVFQPYPIKIPIYKTVYHHVKRVKSHDNIKDRTGRVRWKKGKTKTYSGEVVCKKKRKLVCTFTFPKIRKIEQLETHFNFQNSTVQSYPEDDLYN